VIILLTVAIFVAPFLALLIAAEAGLALLALALCAATFLLREAIADAPARLRPGLRVLLGINIVLVLACLAALGWLFLRG
jgi:hypothetical protein